ncbi:MAG: tRNA dihydrouridine synthase DusB [Desulfobacteraceae bacterium]|nr:tRNA dihydrouridine synthase DusB [Desulfobacteraceae bacterium]
MKIKELEIHGKTFLAPLAGITNLPFRRLVKECGCAVVCSEMISAKGIFYNSEKTITLLTSREDEKPLSVQLFGADPESMAQAAAFVEKMGVADIIDINFGCSVKKVVKQGAGVALMKEPRTCEAILKAVRKATNLPFTIKIRSGWDESGRQAFALANIAQETGVNAITVHPRTAVQGFKGLANWDLIKKIKEQLTIPVIGNGDINCVEDAAKMISQTKCDAVMVGRAAMSNPYLLSQIENYMTSGTYQEPKLYEIFRKMERLIELYLAYFGEQHGVRMLRGRLPWFIKGLPGSSAFRKVLAQITTSDQALALIREYENPAYNQQ